MIEGASWALAHVRWRQTTPTPHDHPEWPGIPEIVGTPHNRLLTSICHAMGMDEVNSVGATSVIATDGTTIDLTGPLDRLV